MEQADATQYLDEPEMSVYPDLDYVPSFPWLGRSDAGQDVHHAESIPQSVDSIVHEGFVTEDPEFLAETVSNGFSSSRIEPASLEESAFGPERFGTQNYTSKDPNDSSLDPDFQFVDDIDMYVFLITTVSQS